MAVAFDNTEASFRTGQALCRRPATAWQRGSDCLDRLIAEADADALEDCLVGFLAQLRNEADVANIDKTSTWTSAISFVTNMLRFAGSASGARASEMEAKLLRLDTLYRQLVPNPKTPAPPVRALPPLVIEDLYEIFNPDSPHKAYFKTSLAEVWDEKFDTFVSALRSGGGCSTLRSPARSKTVVLVGDAEVVSETI
ncbi:hypothetical protein LJR235_004647 [Pararhizobium sp. LjRoot235]|uniref:hypothetical protein n=1 Tax=Pararhizobium sp. LjRoot235 TaxID=3342291 RepID=UPI003ECC9577